VAVALALSSVGFAQFVWDEFSLGMLCTDMGAGATERIEDLGVNPKLGAINF